MAKGTSPQAEADTGLRLRGITKRFGSLVANDAIDLDIVPGRDPLSARGERGRQVDPDERALRAAPARRGHDHHRRRAARQPQPKEAIAAGIGMVHQHFMLVEVFTVAENLILGRERGDGRPAGHAPGPAYGPRALRALPAGRRPRRAGRGAAGRGAAAGRDLEGPGQRREVPDLRRADGGAHAAGDRRADRGDALAAGRGQGDRLHHPQAARGPGDRGQDHGDPARQGRGHGQAHRLRGRSWPS